MKSPTARLTPGERARAQTLENYFQTTLSWERDPAFRRAVLRDTAFAGENGYLLMLDALHGYWLDTVDAWLAGQPIRARQRLRHWTLGHILPGNHPGALLSALMPGWLMGCRQLVRPSTQLQHATRALVKGVAKALGPALPEQRLVTWDHRQRGSAERLQNFLAECDAVTVQGSDLTVSAIKSAWQALPQKQRPHLMAFAHRLSVIAWDCGRDDPDEPDRLAEDLGWYWDAVKKPTRADRLAQFLTMGDQRGCLCPQGVVWVGLAARRRLWDAALAKALLRLRLTKPAPAREEQLAAGYQHAVYLQLAKTDRRFAVRTLGPGGRRGRLWQVPAAEPPQAIRGSCWYLWQAETWAQAGQLIRAWNVPLQAVGCFGPENEVRAALRGVDAWVCWVTALHYPSPGWPQDGCDLLTRLMRLAGKSE